VTDAATQVDLFGGARFNDVKADLQLYPGAVNPNGRRTVQSRDWVDGFVGARARYAFARGWSAVGYADLGAGGSKFTGQALGGVEYSITPRFDAKFGYRYLKTDYDNDGFLYDVGNGGFFLGLGICF
jgi:opacity protein-like surface antigen